MPSVRVLLIGDAIMKGIQISLAELEVFPCTTCPHPLLRLDFPMFLAAKRGIPQRWRDHGRGTGWPNPPVLCSSVAEDLLRNLWFLLGEGERSCSLRMPSQGVQGASVVATLWRSENTFVHTRRARDNVFMGRIPSTEPLDHLEGLPLHRWVSWERDAAHHIVSPSPSAREGECSEPRSFDSYRGPMDSAINSV